MKSHLLILEAPHFGPLHNQFGLCEEIVPAAESFMAMSGINIRQEVMQAKGLCRQCRKIFLAREEVGTLNAKQWVYQIVSGQEYEQWRGQNEI